MQRTCIIYLCAYQIFLSGGFKDGAGAATQANARKIYEYVPNSHFRFVGDDEVEVGGATMIDTQKNPMEF